VSIKTKTELNGKIGIIEIKGALIGDNDTDDFRTKVNDFIEQGIIHIVVDMEKVNYMNSLGIGALISAHTSCVKNGGMIILSGIGKNIQNLLIVTKLIDIFEVHDEVDDAIDAIVKLKTK
jgi:anti-sigma B factor antagonist